MVLNKDDDDGYFTLPLMLCFGEQRKFLMKLYQQLHETSGNIFSRSYVSNSVKLLKCCLNVSLLWESSILQAQNSFKLPKNILQIIIKCL